MTMVRITNVTALEALGSGPRSRTIHSASSFQVAISPTELRR